MPKLIGDKPLTAAERSKRWREKNPDRAKEIQERYKLNHPNAQKEAARRYYRKNAKKENERTVKYRNENRDKTRAHQRKSWHKNREKNLERKKAWMKKNKDKVIEKQTKRRALELNCKTFLILPKELFRLKNSPCRVCGSTKSIEIDHVIPLSRGGSHGIGNLQPLCKSCNTSKHARFMTEWYKAVGRRY